MIGVMGQISCYTGKEVTWEQIMASDYLLPAQAGGLPGRHGAADQARAERQLPRARAGPGKMI